MQTIDKETIEKYLLVASREKALFPEFEFVTESNGPVCIGKGGVSIVYLMTNRDKPDSFYALKVTGFSEICESSESFWNSSRLQRILCEDNDYVVRTIGAVELVINPEDESVTPYYDSCAENWEEDNFIHLRCLLMEKLDPVIEKDRFGKAVIPGELLKSENEIIDLALQIGYALMRAHFLGVLHRDIKLENILYDKKSRTYKLGDFSMAKYTGGDGAETVVYTDGYGAPEIERHFNDSYNETADTYSFGITLYLLFNDLKFPGSDGYFSRAELQYSPEYVFPAPAHASEELTRIIRKMCSFKPEDRYRFLGEALTEIIAYSERSDLPETQKICEEVEMETETFHEESDDSSEKTESNPGRRTRSQIKDVLTDNYFTEAFITKILMVILTLLLIPAYGIGRGAEYVTEQPLLWLMPAGLLIEALFLKVREFHVLFAIIFEIFLIRYAFESLPHIPLIAFILSAVVVILGMRELSFAVGTSLFTWMLITICGKAVFPGLMSFRICQIILLILILGVFAAFFYFKIMFYRERMEILAEYE